MGISLHPDEFSSGGFFDPGVYKFTDTRFTVFDYNGQAKPGIALHATLVSVETGQPSERYWSVGPTERWTHSPDGQELFPVGNAKAVSENCNFAALHASLLKAGYPTEQLRTDRVGAIYDGLVAYLDNVKAAGRENMEPRAARINPQTGLPFPEREATIVVVLEVKEYPNGTGQGATGQAGAAPGAQIPQGPSARPAAQRPSGPTATRGAATATRPASATSTPSTNGNEQDQSPPTGNLGEQSRDAVLSMVYAQLALAGEGGMVSRQDLMTLGISQFRGTPVQPVAMGLMASTEAWQKWEAEGLISLHDGGTKVGMPAG